MPSAHRQFHPRPRAVHARQGPAQLLPLDDGPAWRTAAGLAETSGADVLLAHPCQYLQAPPALALADLPSVYFCHEPRRIDYEPALRGTRRSLTRIPYAPLHAAERALADALLARGFDLISGGTDNHLMLVDLRSFDPELSGKKARSALDRSGISLNENTVPDDPRPPYITSGLRIGTPAVTTQGMREPEMAQVAELIHRVLVGRGDDAERGPERPIRHEARYHEGGERDVHGSVEHERRPVDDDCREPEERDEPVHVGEDRGAGSRSERPRPEHDPG